MSSTLTLEYEFSRDDDNFGWLAAKVETARFSGSNGMWVQWQDLRDFAETLGRYPIQPDDPVAAEWGFGEANQSDLITTTITKLSIAPRGRTGALIADVALADYYDPTNRCSTHFETDYPAVSRLKDEIERMMRDRSGCAVLHGSADIR